MIEILEVTERGEKYRGETTWLVIIDERNTIQAVEDENLQGITESLLWRELSKRSVHHLHLRDFRKVATVKNHALREETQQKFS